MLLILTLAFALAEEPAAIDFYACDADRALYCSGVNAKMDRVTCLRNETRTSTSCVALLDYFVALNTTVNTTCAPYKSTMCKNTVYTPGTETLYICYRSHTAEILEANGDACIAALAVQLWAQEQKKAVGL